MSVDCAAGFVVAVLLGPGVKEVADLPRRVAGAATVHFEDEREEARPGRGAERGRGRHMAVEAVALAAGRRVGGGHAHAAVEVARGGADARARVGRAVDDGDVDDGGLVRRRVRFGLEVGAQDAEVGVAAVEVTEIGIVLKSVRQRKISTKLLLLRLYLMVLMGTCLTHFRGMMCSKTQLSTSVM